MIIGSLLSYCQSNCTFARDLMKSSEVKWVLFLPLNHKGSQDFSNSSIRTLFFRNIASQIMLLWSLDGSVLAPCGITVAASSRQADALDQHQEYHLYRVDVADQKGPKVIARSKHKARLQSMSRSILQGLSWTSFISGHFLTWCLFEWVQLCTPTISIHASRVKLK